MAVDDEGRITALYFAKPPNGVAFYFVVTPDGIESSIRKNVLRYTRPESRMRYRFSLTGDDTLTFRYTRKGKSYTLEMSRRERSGCATRIAAPNAD